MIFQTPMIMFHVNLPGCNTCSETIRHLEGMSWIQILVFHKGFLAAWFRAKCYNQVVLILFGSNFVGFGFWNPTELI